jgi:Flp pilus assembly protein TadB
MPLSENEQRILRQIEQQLERDPTFSSRGYRVPRRRVVGLSLALVAALVITVLLLSASVWLSIAAFVGTLVLAVALEREVRLIAREKVGALPVSAWLVGGRGRAGGRPSAESPTEEYDG